MNPNTGLLISKLASIGFSVLVIVSAFFVWFYSSKIEAENNKKINELVRGKDQLIAQNKELILKIEEYQTDLKRKEEKIKQLQIETKKASRGISSTYDFNGTQRITTRPGHISVYADSEVTVFNTIQKLQAEKKFSELVKVCEEQIKKTPDWLTPYLFLGVAYANLGEKEKAIKNFEYVLENAPGDPAYEQAAEFIRKLKGK